MGLLDDRQSGLLAMQHNIDPRYKAAARAPAAQVLRGLLAPQQLAEMALAFAPGSGDAMAVRDGQQNFADMRKSIEGGDYGKAASDAIYGTTAYASALPVLGAAIPHFGGMVKAVRGAGKAADLPMDEASRMARADEHFPVEAFHGTNKDFPEFGARGSVTKAKSAKKAYWFVEDPKSAGGYADNAADSDVQKLIDASQAAERRGEWDNANSLMVQAEKLEQSTPHRGQSVIPARLGGNLKEVDMDGVQYDPDDVNLSEILDGAKSEGFDGVKLMNFSDEAGYGQYNPTTHYAVFDPKNIRSRFAKFDPKNRNSRDLLAGVAGAGLLAAPVARGMLADDQQPY